MEPGVCAQSDMYGYGALVFLLALDDSARRRHALPNLWLGPPGSGIETMVTWLPGIAVQSCAVRSYIISLLSVFILAGGFIAAIGLQSNKCSSTTN